MAQKSKWNTETLCQAIEEIKDKKLSYREAEAKYHIPRSTLGDYITGKAQIGRKQGPQPVLTQDEELALATWATEMAQIGYGQTKRQILEVVKKILDKDGRPNPFADNRPGKDWWYGFLARNKLGMRSASALEGHRASACTEEKLLKWYINYEQFLLSHGVSDDPSRIWNCDESGFPLCPKASKILAPRGTKTVYAACSASKQQITTLVAINASGEVLPPMHIFPGERFSYFPLEGAVQGAYFGKSHNGWINSELFFGWVSKFFSKMIGVERPVVLLLDGHTSHINLEVSKFCKEAGILLYCLPPHSSHITQPLDVGFFSPLKANWKRAVDAYRVANIGKPVTKEVFARVFKEAWTNSVKMKTIVNAFSACGLFPVDAHRVLGAKVLPSKVYVNPPSTASDSSSGAHLALHALEAELTNEIKEIYEKRFSEGYNVETDTLYNVWFKLKKAVHSQLHTTCNPNPIPELESLSVSTPFKEALKLPDPVPKKTCKTTVKLPSHISGSEMISFLEERKRKKEEEETKKLKRKMEREARKKLREREKAEKAARGRGRRGRGRGCRRGRGHGRGCGSGCGSGRGLSMEKLTSSSSSSDEGVVQPPSITCPVCGLCESEDEEDTQWVCCDKVSCSTWYHVHCTDIDPQEDIESLAWICPQC